MRCWSNASLPTLPALRALLVNNVVDWDEEG